MFMIATCDACVMLGEARVVHVEGQKLCGNEAREKKTYCKQKKKQSRCLKVGKTFCAVVLSSPFKFALIKSFLSFLMETFFFLFSVCSSRIF